MITLSETEINKFLVKFDRTKYITDTQEEIKTLSESNVEVIKGVFQNDLKRRIKNASRRIETKVRNAMSKLRDHNEVMNQVSRDRQELETLQVLDYSKIVAGFNEISSDNRFEILKVTSNGEVHVLIKDDIINTYKNERTSVDLRVNLGKLLMVFDLNSGNNLMIHKYQNNLICPNNDHGEIYHPHLSNEGDICLGNMEELFNEKRKANDLFGMAEIANQVMITYYDGNPYVNLVNFAQISEQVQPNGEIIEREENEECYGSDRYQEHECPECGHDHEICFEPESISDFAVINCPECDYEHDYEYTY